MKHIKFVLNSFLPAREAYKARLLIQDLMKRTKDLSQSLTGFNEQDDLDWCKGQQGTAYVANVLATISSERNIVTSLCGLSWSFPLRWLFYELFSAEGSIYMSYYIHILDSSNYWQSSQFKPKRYFWGYAIHYYLDYIIYIIILIWFNSLEGARHVLWCSTIFNRRTLFCSEWIIFLL